MLIVADSLIKRFIENCREKHRKNHKHHKTTGGQSPNKHKANIIEQGQKVAREEKFKTGRDKTLHPNKVLESRAWITTNLSRQETKPTFYYLKSSRGMILHLLPG